MQRASIHKSPLKTGAVGSNYYLPIMSDEEPIFLSLITQQVHCDVIDLLTFRGRRGWFFFDAIFTHCPDGIAC
jgi:hypothetical protein